MRIKDYDGYRAIKFTKHQPFIQISPSGKQTLYRYLGESEHFIYAVKLGEQSVGAALVLNEDDASTTNREVFKRRRAESLFKAGLLKPVMERAVPLEMEDDKAIESRIRFKQEFGKEDVRDMTARRRMMMYIEGTFGDDPFRDEATYSEMVKCVSDLFQADAKTVRKYYERHLFYGGHRNATAEQHWKKGGKSKKRRGLKKDGEYVLQGRKPSAERLDADSHLGRKQLRPRMLTRWVSFIREHAHNLSLTITELLERFKLKLVGYNRNKQGEVEYHPIDPRYYPPDSSMLDEGQKALVEARIELDRRKNEGKRAGSTAQLADGDLNVFDIDGTVATQFLEFGNDLVQIDGVLKPTFLVAMDRGSRCCVGYYVTLGNENADAYLACMFSAYTDKERELLRWGVPRLDGLVHGYARKIFVDRYAGISEKMQHAIVTRMKEQLLMAAPGDPEAKGDVENLIGYLQKELGNLPGSSYQEPVKGTGDEKDEARARNRLKLKDAPRGAVITFRQFMQAFLTAISKYNLTADVRHLRTNEMAAAKVAPVPKEVFLYNQSLQRGDAAWDWPEEKIFRTLSVPFERSASGGIVRLGNREYTSPRLQQRAREYSQRNGGKAFPVKGFELFTSPLHLLWDDDGYLECLDATEGTLKVYGDGYKFLHDYISTLSNADLAKKRDRERFHSTVANVVAKPVSKVKQAAMAKVEGFKTKVTKTEAKEVAADLGRQADTDDLIDGLSGKRGSKGEVAPKQPTPGFIEPSRPRGRILADW
ncbi:hypothetical protein AWB74_07194 [Caballeronia arvi]|uniref:Integrase catalytic domain-containing protein n=1 Tax=Caballeronia arvi TaxID=1777135 RepID=A0A158KVG4_9BURK|nr:hypothetical protein [Caballeronia arvi]SAL85156.1 hypothetical protein AWB74_07194 [Caballeronia arvi]